MQIESKDGKILLDVDKSIFEFYNLNQERYAKSHWTEAQIVGLVNCMIKNRQSFKIDYAAEGTVWDTGIYCGPAPKEFSIYN